MIKRITRNLSYKTHGRILQLTNMLSWKQECRLYNMMNECQTSIETDFSILEELSFISLRHIIGQINEDRYKATFNLELESLYYFKDSKSQSSFIMVDELNVENYKISDRTWLFFYLKTIRLTYKKIKAYLRDEEEDFYFKEIERLRKLYKAITRDKNMNPYYYYFDNDQYLIK